MPHSDAFHDYAEKIGPEYQLQSEKIISAIISGLSYRDVTYLLREINDAQMGIVSTFNEGDNTWVRDATNSYPLNQRMPHNAPVIEANNALLRSLSRLEAIDYAISKKLRSHGHALRQNIQKELRQLITDMTTIARDPQTSAHQKRKAIKNVEKIFNTFLIKQLYQAGLTRGCYTSKDAMKLLAYYRDLSSVLVSTPAIITLTYDEQAQLLQRETAIPVTKKTERQKKDIAILKKRCPFPDKSEKNAHTIRNIAEQEADALFEPRIKSDDTMLPAQRRGTHLVGTKNTFLVKVELIAQPPLTPINAGQTAHSDDILWLVRSGSPVFTGKGETPETVQRHTQENLNQITAKMKSMGVTPPLHIVTLNTNTPLKQQSTIIHHVTLAAKERQIPLSYAPCNAEGTCRSLHVAHGIFADKKAPQGIAPGHKATRMTSITSIVLTAAKRFTNVIQCASGQDRTGTAVEKTIQEWTKQRYQTKGIKNTTTIEVARAKGGHAADIATHLVPGSPGMKADSCATDWLRYKTLFSKETTKEWYRDSAETNKENNVADVSFLQNPSQYELDAYFKEKSELVSYIINTNGHYSFPKNQKPQNKSPYLQDKALHQLMNEIITHTDDIVETHVETLTAEHIVCASIVLHAVKKGLQDIQDPKKSAINASRLTALAKHLSQQSSRWHTLGQCLLVIARMLVPCLKKTKETLASTRREAQNIRKVGEQLKQFGNTLHKKTVTPSPQDTTPVSRISPKGG